MRILQAATILVLGGLMQIPLTPVATAQPSSFNVTNLNEAELAANSQKSSRGSRKLVVVTGKLTGEGAECQALRANNGALYTLAGNLKGFKVGDRVRVVGKVAEVSTCMQGTTLRVVSIKKS